MACDTPTWIKYKQPKKIGEGWQYAFPADCGKCLMCLRKRKAQWSYRLMEEKLKSFSSYFVTLTYKDEFVPFGEDGYCANKNDHTEFIKWLNYYETSQKLSERDYISSEELLREKNKVHEIGDLRYLACIEYGDRFDRPHWHYIIFNVVDTDNINKAWSTQICTKPRGFQRAAEYKPGTSKGRIDIDECNVNTVDYVLKYMMKHEGEKQQYDREEERAFMSKGLGSREPSPEFLRFISKPENNQVVNQRGVKVALPRIFRKKYLSEAELAAKQEFVSKVALETKEKKELELLRNGRDLEEARISQINARNNVLKNRRRRNTD